MLNILIKIKDSKALIWSKLCLVIFSIPFLGGQTSCKKFVEVDAPITSLNAKNVYTNDAAAAAVLTGVYAFIGNGQVFSGSSGIGLCSGLNADELTLWSGGLNNENLRQFYQNNLMAEKPIAPSYWQQLYSMILTTNSAIEGLESSTVLTPAVRLQLLGESKFLRAFFHFYLVNFYGDIPLTTSSDWRINSIANRTPKQEVYKQIINDLKEAKDMLTDKYVKSDALTSYAANSEERVRPTRWAAQALLARVYLYIGDWQNAETEASEVIGSSSFGLNTLDAAFKKNNKEAIWQIQYTNTSFGTEGFHFLLTTQPNGTTPTYLSNFLLNAFDSADNRKKMWIDSFSASGKTFYYPRKYRIQSNPNNTEYFMVLRLAEQFLIRAEARVQQNKIGESQADMNAIRNRAGLVNISSNDKSSLLASILHERQVELFTEWGHRWFDLKRTGNIDAIMSVVYPTKKIGGMWNTNWQLYPLSSNDIKLNPNLAPNNEGY